MAAFNVTHTSAAPKSEVIPVRIDPTTRELIVSAATAAKVSLSEYMRAAAIESLNAAAKIDAQVVKEIGKLSLRFDKFEGAIDRLNGDLNRMQSDNRAMKELVELMGRRQEKMRSSDATTLETLEKIGILVANMAKPLGLPKIFDALVDDLTKPKT